MSEREIDAADAKLVQPTQQQIDHEVAKAAGEKVYEVSTLVDHEARARISHDRRVES